jgi:hypothetical protein
LEAGGAVLGAFHPTQLYRLDMARTAIIILDWNNYQMTAECIRSLLVMDAANYEVLVGSGGRDFRALFAIYRGITQGLRPFFKDSQWQRP